MEALQNELSLLQQRDFSSDYEEDLLIREKELMLEIQETLQQQHLLLSQKSRVHWLADGDRNIAFFHWVLRTFRAKASLNSMMINGELCEDADTILAHIQEFYRDL